MEGLSASPSDWFWLWPVAWEPARAWLVWLPLITPPMAITLRAASKGVRQERRTRAAGRIGRKRALLTVGGWHDRGGPAQPDRRSAFRPLRSCAEDPITGRLGEPSTALNRLLR